MLKSLFDRNTGLKTFKVIKKRLQHWCLPVNIAKSLRTPFLSEHVSGGCFCITPTQVKDFLSLKLMSALSKQREQRQRYQADKQKSLRKKKRKHVQKKKLIETPLKVILSLTNISHKKTISILILLTMTKSSYGLLNKLSIKLKLFMK